MRTLVVAAIAAISFVNVVSVAQAAVEVRDHRTKPVVRDHRTGPVVRDHRQSGPVIRDHRSPAVVSRPGGGVTVTSSSRPRPRGETKACLLGVACTTNKTVVGVAEKTMPPITRIIPR